MLESFSSAEPDPWSKLNIKINFDWIFSKKKTGEKEIKYLTIRLKPYLKFFDENLHKNIVSDALESYQKSFELSNFPNYINILEQFEKDFKFIISKIWNKKSNIIRFYKYIQNWRFFAPSPKPDFHHKQINEMIQEIFSIKI